MKTRMYFDTETTGLVNFKFPMNHPSQPRVVQYAAVLVAPDWTEVASVNLLRRPDGFSIPDGAAAVHGISTAKATAFGVSMLTILSAFQDMAARATQLVAHNIEFDLKVIDLELHRERVGLELGHQEILCTMKSSMNICKLPGGRNGEYKWPKLAELYHHLFGEVLEGAHDALVDVRACVRCHRAMLERGLLKEITRH